MVDITTVLGLQVRARRNALTASRALRKRRLDAVEVNRLLLAGGWRAPAGPVVPAQRPGVGATSERPSGT